MKIVNQVNARALWYVTLDEINPQGLDWIPIYAAIRARYSFAAYPARPEDLQPTTGGVVFGRGAFRSSDGPPIEIARLEIFRDGLLLDTRHSTGMSDLILSDILAFASHGNRLAFEPRMIRKKAFLSEVVVTTELSLGNLSPGIEGFCRLLGELTGEGQGFALDQIRFGTDVSQAPIPLRFRFERREGVAFSDNRYFSQAPTTTERHQQLLDALEDLLAPRARRVRS